MPVDDNELVVSTVALVAGNSVVDDLWDKYFPDFDDYPAVARAVLLEAHVQAVLHKHTMRKDFVRAIEDDTGWGEEAVKNAIALLLENKILERRRDNPDDTRRVNYYPTPESKDLLIKMGCEYAEIMHQPIASLLGNKQTGEFKEDIQTILRAKIHDY